MKSYRKHPAAPIDPNTIPDDGGSIEFVLTANDGQDWPCGTPLG